jgi:hypothetical protein
MSRKSFIIGIVGILSFAVIQAVPILAQTQSGQSDTDQEQSALSNPTQAAHAQNLANAAVANDPQQQRDFNTTMGEIAGMREAGMGWGEIAHALGVHPGTLGLGHNKGVAPQSPTETQLATARNPQTGEAIGHGVSNGHSEGKGSEHGQGSADKDGKSESNGNGQGHGGDHGNGNGGGGGHGHK